MINPIKKRDFSELDNKETQEPISKKTKIDSSVSKQVLGLNLPQIPTISSQYGVEKMDVDRIDRANRKMVITSGFSFTLLDLPEEILVQIFMEVVRGSGEQQYLKLISVCHKIKRIVQGDVLTLCWDQLKIDRFPLWMHRLIEKLKRKDSDLSPEVRGYTQFVTLVKKIRKICHGRIDPFSCILKENSDFQVIEQAIEDANLMHLWSAYLLFITNLTQNKKKLPLEPKKLKTLKELEAIFQQINTVPGVKKILSVPMHKLVQKLILHANKLKSSTSFKTEAYVNMYSNDFNINDSVININSEKQVKLQYIIPREIRYFSNLQFLDLSKMGVTNLPDELGELVSLTSLMCWNNNLNSIPSSFTKLTGLTDINFNNNRFNLIPEPISAITGLNKLCINLNRISVVPDFIGCLTNLKQLLLGDQFHETFSTGSLSNALGMVTNLQILDLSGWNLNAIPDWIRNFNKLEMLNLCRNQLSLLPDCLIYCSRLSYLNISENKFNKVPGVLSNLLQLDNLKIDGNQICSFENICSLKKLSVLHIEGNPILSLPACLMNGNLNKLKLDSHLLSIAPEILNLFPIDPEKNEDEESEELTKELEDVKDVIFVYNLEKQYTSTSSLGQLYQAILHFYDENEIKPQVKEAFERLIPPFKELILILAKSTVLSGLFKEITAFYYAVREVIRTELEKLSNEEKEILFENFVAAADALEALCLKILNNKPSAVEGQCRGHHPQGHL